MKMMVIQNLKISLITVAFVAIGYGKAQVRRCVGLRELTFHETLKNIGHADNHCISLGGRLVKVDNADITEAITGAIQSNANYYIGAKRISNGGRFFWRDGSSVPLPAESGYSDWKSGEPNDGKEHCVLIRNSDGWSDYPCDVARYFICQKEFSITASLTPPDRVTITDTGKYNVTCTATATECATPTVTWYRNGNPVSKIATRNVYQSGGGGSAVLWLQKVSITDSGGYRCRATADGKQSNWVTATVIAEGSPIISNLTATPCSTIIAVSWEAHPLARGLPHKLNVYPSSSPGNRQTRFINENEISEISDLLPSTEYAVEIIACTTDTNCPTEYMTKKSVTTRGPPNSARGINLVYHNGKCRLSWQQPAVVGDPITGYEVTLTERIVSYRVDITEKGAIVNVANTSYGFVPLPNRGYSSSVKSLSCDGSSKPINASGTCMGAPQVPAILESPTVSVRSTEVGSISLNFPDETNGLISCIFVIISNGTRVGNETRNESEYTYQNILMANTEAQRADFYITFAIPASRFASKNELVLPLGDNTITSCNSHDTSHATNIAGYCRGNGTTLALNKPLMADSSYEAFVIAVVPNGTSLLFGRSSVTQFSTHRPEEEDKDTTPPSYHHLRTDRPTQTDARLQTSPCTCTSSSQREDRTSEQNAIQFHLISFLIGFGGALLVGFCFGVLAWKLYQDHKNGNGPSLKSDDLPAQQDQNCYENLSTGAPENFPESPNCYETLSVRIPENHSENLYALAGIPDETYSEMRSPRAETSPGSEYEMDPC